MKIIYQLSAIGRSLNGGKFNGKSRKVFLTEQAAIDHIPEFREKCTDENQINAADPEGLIIKPFELQLVEEND